MKSTVRGRLEHSPTGKGGRVDLFREVQQFVACLRVADDLEAVVETMITATKRFGFDHFGLIQRAKARSSVTPVRLSNFPASWCEQLARDEYYAHDPVLVASRTSISPFSWDELPNLITMTRQHHEFLANAGAQGLSHGYTIPIHVPGEASGLCSFVITGNRALPAASLPAAQYLACFAFEAARRLGAQADLELAPRMTQRQLDCVVLVAQGKSDWVAGKLLGLSPDTVHKYLETAKKRYNVSSRTELVVRALYDGQLSFADVLN